MSERRLTCSAIFRPTSRPRARASGPGDGSTAASRGPGARPSLVADSQLLATTTRRFLFSRSRHRLTAIRSEEHTSELQSHHDLVCRLLLEKKKKKSDTPYIIISLVHIHG